MRKIGFRIVAFLLTFALLVNSAPAHARNDLKPLHQNETHLLSGALTQQLSFFFWQGSNQTGLYSTRLLALAILGASITYAQTTGNQPLTWETLDWTTRWSIWSGLLLAGSGFIYMLWTFFKPLKHYGSNKIEQKIAKRNRHIYAIIPVALGGILLARASSVINRTMTASIPQEVIQERIQQSPAAAVLAWMFVIMGLMAGGSSIVTIVSNRMAHKRDQASFAMRLSHWIDDLAHRATTLREEEGAKGDHLALLSAAARDHRLSDKEIEEALDRPLSVDEKLYLQDIRNVDRLQGRGLLTGMSYVMAILGFGMTFIVLYRILHFNALESAGRYVATLAGIGKITQLFEKPIGDTPSPSRSKQWFLTSLIIIGLSLWWFGALNSLVDWITNQISFLHANHRNGAVAAFASLAIPKNDPTRAHRTGRSNLRFLSAA